MYLYISFTNKVALVFSGCFPYVSHCLPVRFLTLWFIKIRWSGSTCEHLVMTAQPHLTLQRKVTFHNHCYPHCCSNFSNWSLNVHIYTEHHFTRMHARTHRLLSMAIFWVKCSLFVSWTHNRHYAFLVTQRHPQVHKFFFTLWWMQWNTSFVIHEIIISYFQNLMILHDLITCR